MTDLPRARIEKLVEASTVPSTTTKITYAVRWTIPTHPHYPAMERPHRHVNPDGSICELPPVVFFPGRWTFEEEWYHQHPLTVLESFVEIKREQVPVRVWKDDAEG